MLPEPQQLLPLVRHAAWQGTVRSLRRLNEAVLVTAMDQEARTTESCCEVYACIDNLSRALTDHAQAVRQQEVNDLIGMYREFKSLLGKMNRLRMMRIQDTEKETGRLRIG